VKILVADDDAISRCVMERTLRRAGYDVVLAENGRDALETLVSANAPRLALLDWMMPGLDGPAVCLEVRSHRERPYSYIALLTSKGAKEDLIAGLEAGADDYLTKPCHPEELKARLRTGERILRLEDTLVDAREEMRYKATHDALTSLWNRAAILAHLNNEIHRARRDAKISLLLCDVDHFKRINDVHGHLVGDLVLQEIAQRLVSAIRPGDAVGRLGGEEFLVILTDCGEESLYHRGEQLRQAVASSSFAGNLQDLSVSISIGAMTIQPEARGQKVETYLNQADTALYRAKLEGRNRVIIAERQLLPAIPLIENRYDHHSAS
jgi:two-component system, cell cycle response regulator